MRCQTSATLASSEHPESLYGGTQPIGHAHTIYQGSQTFGENFCGQLGVPQTTCAGEMQHDPTAGTGQIGHRTPVLAVHATGELLALRMRHRGIGNQPSQPHRPSPLRPPEA